MRFGYHRDLLDRCPELTAGVIWIDGLTNREMSREANHALAQAIELTRERFLAPPDIARFDSITAWRQIYSRLGVKPNRYPCAAEGLIRRVIELGTLPRISALVDLCNAVSLRYAIPVAPFDRAKVVGDCVVRFALGSERFLPIGAGEPEPIPEEEVVYVDDTPDVLSRRWNWRQADKGKIRVESTTVLITTEAVHDTGRDAVEAAVTELCETIHEVLGGSIQADILDSEHPFSERVVRV
jgi:DNA/RNA-binding domain of Phe-tRNA-synthetase-like protein